jgi:hypothetical protein
MTNAVLIDLGRAYLCLNCDAIGNWAVCCSRCGFDVLLPLVSAIAPASKPTDVSLLPGKQYSQIKRMN